MADDVGELANETLAEQQGKGNKLEETTKKEAKKYNNQKKEKGFFRKAFDLVYLTAISAAATVLSVATTGPLGALVGLGFAGGGLIGDLKKKTKSVFETVSDFFKTYFSINLVIYPVVLLGNATYPIVGAIGSKLAGPVGSVLAKTGYAVTAYNAAFVAKFKAAYHLAGNYLSPKGIVKGVKEDYMPLTKRINTGMAPALALTANGIDSLLGIPVFALNAVPVGYYHATNPLEKKNDTNVLKHPNSHASNRMYNNKAA